MERDVEVDCHCPKCGHEWTEKQTVEIEPPEPDESRS